MGSFGSWQAAQPDELALVPWADMFRHSPDAGPQAIAHYSTRLGGVTLAAHRRYAPGEEVFDSCGPNLSAVDMLLDYGVCNLAAAAAAAQAPVPPGAAAAAEAAAALAAAAARAAAGGLVEEAEEPPAGGQPDRCVQRAIFSFLKPLHGGVA